MKFLVIDDEHDLYKVMYADLFKNNEYNIEEIPKFTGMSAVLNKLRKLHFDDRINRHLNLPGKSVWNKLYSLSHYSFDPDEEYWVIFLNGTLRNYYSAEYLTEFKNKHSNVRLAMVMYDSFSNSSAQRAIDMMPVFDRVFSFDKGDCERHGCEYIFSTFSAPDFVKKDEHYKNKAFFVGAAVNRLDLLEACFSKIARAVKGCEFRIVGVSKEKQKYPELIKYNERLSYEEALQYSYNSDCIVEIVREGQTGVSLRTCEAIIFNKKLITNNTQLANMPFYNPKYMRIFNDAEQIDLDFIKQEIEVDYNYDGCFSPLVIIEKLLNQRTTDI